MVNIAIAEEPSVAPNKGGQADFVNDWIHRIVALEGGWYSGKTWAGARKLVQAHIINSFGIDGLATFIPSFVVAPTYMNAQDFCVPELQTAIEECGLTWAYRATGSLAGGRFAAPAIIIEELGTKQKPSAILIRSADTPKRITGFTAGYAWGDEPARWKHDPFDPVNDPYIQMLGRVRGDARIKQIIFTYTNEGDATNIFDQMHDGNEMKALYRAGTSTNPHAKEFEEVQRDLLTPELVQQYMEGVAVSLKGGKVYSSFDFDMNVKSDLIYRKDLPLQLSIDFNIVPGMHMLLGQYHTDSDIFTEIDEIFGNRWTVEMAMDKVFSILKDLDYTVTPEKPMEIYGDSTGGSEWTGTGKSNYFIVQNKLKAQGIPYRIRVPKGNPLVQDRVNAFNCALHDITGQIHYFCSPKCNRLIEDFRKLQRDKYGEISTVDKKLSHASDAVGYKVHYLRPVRVKTERRIGRFSVV